MLISCNIARDKHLSNTYMWNFSIRFLCCVGDGKIWNLLFDAFHSTKYSLVYFCPVVCYFCEVMNMDPHKLIFLWWSMIIKPYSLYFLWNFWKSRNSGCSVCIIRGEGAESPAYEFLIWYLILHYIYSGALSGHSPCAKRLRKQSEL